VDGYVCFRGLGRGWRRFQGCRRFTGGMRLKGITFVVARTLPTDIDVFALIASMFGAG